jgi:hypothetical protein
MSHILAPLLEPGAKPALDMVRGFGTYLLNIGTAFIE